MNEKFRRILEEKLEGYREGAPGEIQAYCPFPHAGGTSDSEGGSRSFSTNYEKETWRCFSCGKRGNGWELASHVLNISIAEAKKELGHRAPKVREVPNEEVIAAHDFLLDNKEILQILEDRGINKDSVYEHQLGYQPSDHRLWIPIRDEWSRVINVRRHTIDKSVRVKKKFQKTIGYGQGFNKAVLFPVDEKFDELEEIYLCEGEMDCILARQLGLSAFTVTGGAGSWDYKLNKLLAGKKVWIVYDCDPAGNRGALTVAKAMYPAAQELRIVNLDLEAPAKDLTDFFIEKGHTIDELEALVAGTDTFYQSENPSIKDDKAIDTNLAHASSAELYGKKICLTAIVAGKNLAPYIYPKHMRVTCDQNRGKTCGACGLARHNGDATLTVSEYDSDILNFIKVDDKEQRKEIARRLDIVHCNIWKFSIEEAGNIEEIRLIPELSYNNGSSEYVMRVGYYVGHGIRANASYTFVGIAGAEPATQHSVPIFANADAVKGSLEQFEMTEEIIDMLRVFKIEGSNESSGDSVETT